MDTTSLVFSPCLNFNERVMVDSSSSSPTSFPRLNASSASPEKPLSDLGLLSYRQYWTENLVRDSSEDLMQRSLERIERALTSCLRSYP